jgi:hypothetical protein
VITLAFDDLNKKHNKETTKNYLKTHVLETLTTQFLKDYFQIIMQPKNRTYTLFKTCVQKIK